MHVHIHMYTSLYTSTPHGWGLSRTWLWDIPVLGGCFFLILVALLKRKRPGHVVHAMGPNKQL